MIPLRDNIPTRRVPVMTLILIGLNIYVLLKEYLLGPYGGQRFVLHYGLIPCGLTGACRITGRAFSPAVTLVSSMFIHGGLFHLAGNMLYLWIFGNNVEDAMGRMRFLLFYLLCGLGAAFAQIWATPNSRIPMVGASGAISGVLGAYVVLYPGARILTLVPLFFFVTFIEIPAMIVLGFWVVVQVVNGLHTFNFEGGGVAWFAHLGGFLAGMLLIGLFRKRAVAGGRGPRRGWGY